MARSSAIPWAQVNLSPQVSIFFGQTRYSNGFAYTLSPAGGDRAFTQVTYEKICGNGSEPVRSVAFSPNCKNAASGSDDKTVRVGARKRAGEEA